MPFLACFEKNIGYSSQKNDVVNPLSKDSTDARETSKECQELCRQNNYCALFTWNKINKSCKMLKAATQRMISQNDVSGPPECNGTIY